LEEAKSIVSSNKAKGIEERLTNCEKACQAFSQIMTSVVANLSQLKNEIMVSLIIMYHLISINKDSSRGKYNSFSLVFEQRKILFFLKVIRVDSVKIANYM